MTTSAVPSVPGKADVDGSAITLLTLGTASPYSPLAGLQSKLERIEIRKSEPLDASEIEKLVNQNTKQMFGKKCDSLRILEHANLSLTLSTQSGSICGHASFYDYPVTMSSMDPAYWEEWIITKYDNPSNCKITPYNSLFLRFFVYQEGVKKESLQECLKTAFDLVPNLHYILLILPANVRLSSVYTKLFEKLESTCDDFAKSSKADESLSEGEIPQNLKSASNNKDEQEVNVNVENGDVEVDTPNHEHITGSLSDLERYLEGIQPEDYVVYVCRRHTLLPVMHIRTAMEEDSDDLSPLFLRHTDELHSIYGEYFIAELVTGGTENMGLVAEVNGLAVGYVGVSCDAQLDILNRYFRLEPYHGLKKISEQDEIVDIEMIDSKSTLVSDTSHEDYEDDNAVQAVINDKEPYRKERRPSASNSLMSSDKSESQLVPVEAVNDEQMTESIISTTESEGAGENFEDRSIAESQTKISVPEPSHAASSLSHSTTHTQNVAKNRTSATQRTPTINEMEIKPTELITVFKGASNAVSLQLYCMDDKYESRSIDFISEIFKHWSSVDYCILTQPHWVSELPILQHNFIRVPPRAGANFPQELYFAHKGTLLADVRVELACETDREGVKILLGGLPVENGILADFERFLEAYRDKISENATPLYFFVAKCVNQIISAVSIRTEHEIEYIRAKYNIEEFIYFNYHKPQEQGHLQYFVINPLFQLHTKFILKEILRKSHKTCLYYPLYAKDSANFNKYFAISALNHMIPVRPRRQIQYPLENLGINAPIAKITAEHEPYILYHFNRKLTLEPKIVINHRILVIGASDIAISFLQSLVFHSAHLTFNNLTLLSINGLACENNILNASYCFQKYDMIETSLVPCVNILRGVLSEINRKDKYVRTQKGEEIPYDFLILCTGEQYQLPNSLSRKNPIAICNTSNELDSIEEIFTNKFTSNLVIYGDVIEVYPLIRKAIEKGIPGNQIKLIKTNPQSNPFNNRHIQLKMNDVINKLDIDIYIGNVSGYEAINASENIWQLKLLVENENNEIQEYLLQYSLFITFEKKDVNFIAFKAMNDSCLVYDGRLVIDRNFHTNDSSIYAAGSLTKFSRKYYCDPWRLDCYNSREVGERLASEILRNFDPLLVDSIDNGNPKLIPDFTRPKINGCNLPGSFVYLQVHKPCPASLSAEKANSKKNEIVTQTAENGYMRILLDEYGYIEKIICLANTDFEIENIISLYGKHEKLLDSMLSRYKKGLITDLYEFFRDSAVLASLHDRFEDFKLEIDNILATLFIDENSEITFKEKVSEILSKEWRLTDLQRTEISQLYDSSQVKIEVRKHLMNYLNYNYYHLPMYAKGNSYMDKSITI